MKERHKTVCVIFLILTRVNNGVEEILLQKRKNTGYRDEMYDLCCRSYLEEGKSLNQKIIKEANEKLGITIIEEDLELAEVIHDFEDNYLNFFFKTSNYLGVPTIMEPDKCAELLWAPVNDLPIEIITFIDLAIQNMIKGYFYDTADFPYRKKR